MSGAERVDEILRLIDDVLAESDDAEATAPIEEAA
jgi:hypothetical protein